MTDKKPEEILAEITAQVLAEEKQEKAVNEANKIEKTMQKATDKAAEYELAYKKWVEVLKPIKLFYITKENKFYYYGQSESWITTLVDTAVRIKWNIENGIDYEAFMDVMRALGRVKDDGVYSFYHENNPMILNMMNRDLWLKPTEGDHHSIFDVLLNSLSDGREDIKDHIEQIIYWKYTHPEDYRIPAMVIYGEGGLGKNEFVLRVLKTIFHGSKVESLNSEMVVGDYTGMLIGNAVTLVNEVHGMTMKQMAKLKDLIGNQYISLNPKGKSQLTIPATSLMITAGNKINGAVLLDGSASDKRWSPIHCRRNIVLHTMLFAGEDISDFTGMTVSNMSKTDEYKDYEKIMKDSLPRLSDSKEVSKWLGYIVQKWQHLEQTPDCYHGEDYRKLLIGQKGSVENFCDEIFGNRKFNNVSTVMFFKIYKVWIKENGSSWEQKNLLKRKDLVQETDEYLLHAGLNVEYVTKGDNMKLYSNTKRRSFTGYKTLLWDKKPEFQDHVFLDSTEEKLDEAFFGDYDIEEDSENNIEPLF